MAVTVNINMDPVRRRIEQAAWRGVTRSINMVRNEIVHLIRDTAKTGRVYRRRDIEHVASAPGEPPAVDTGNHLRHIAVKYDRPNLSATVNSSSEYAEALEYGTSKMEARPHMRPGLENQRAAIIATITLEIARELA